MRDYTPKIYPGKILFFRAKERDAFLSQNPELAWIDLALEGIEVHIVPGNHITMSSLPNVRFLAKRLKICLEQTKTDYVK
jgi:thioesterase domain-containing protein